MVPQHPDWRLMMLLLMAALTCHPGCGDASGGTVLPALRVSGVGPLPLLPGSTLIIAGDGFVAPEVASLSLRLQTTVDGQPLDLAIAPLRVDDHMLQVEISGALRDLLIRDGQHLKGQLTVTREPLAGGGVEQIVHGIDLPTSITLLPTLLTWQPTLMHVGDTVTLTGDGGLHGTEGATVLRFEGVFSSDAPHEEIPVEGVEVVAVPADVLSRETWNLRLTTQPFGLRPGVFDGVVTVRNEFISGLASEGEAFVPGPLVIARSTIEAVSPPEASRGQRVVVTGDGLIPPDPAGSIGTLLILEGIFSPDRGESEIWTGDDTMAIFPDPATDNHSLSFVLRVDALPDGSITGLGARPGVFDGTITPYLFSPQESALGEPSSLLFTVLPPRQQVHVKLLPAFQDALTLFGLGAEREAVVTRILEILARDYSGISIAFQTSVPQEFAEYSIVEVGGADPNGTGLFGLDNTAGKDVGNVRFDDVIGGFNAETRARGYAAYGGIFVSELLNLSPTLASNPLTSPRFDDVFGPVCPSLGGTQAGLGESAGQTQRAQQIREAVRVLGNLIGSTISHEVGHSLGLTALEGHFHNPGDNPGWLMDAGIYRPFEERAELDGQGPAVFSPDNRIYLESILPP